MITKRYLAIAMAVLVVFVTAGNAYLAIRATNDLSGIVAHELENRVKNVGHWCGGINDTRGQMRSVLARFHVHFTIPNLNCASLKAQTRASGSKP